MAIMNLTDTLKRIDSALPDSPIAVFSTKRGMALNAVFANVHTTQQLIRQEHPSLIGVYHRYMDPATIRQELAAHLKSGQGEMRNAS